MTPLRLLLPLLAAFAIAPATFATPHGDGATVAGAAIDPAAQPAVDVVDRFSTALKAGDLATVRELLADDVLVLESGGAERSKQEYFADHAGADAAFLREAHVQVTGRTARVLGDMAWVGTEAEIHASKAGEPLTLLSSETMVLARTTAGWRIVHIHWSSRPKKS